jgi:hypothetical protein
MESEENIFKKFDKEDGDDLNLAEVKGLVVGQLNNIEMLIGQILIKYFKPAKEEDFKKTILNSSITSFAAKVKVLRGLDIITDNLRQDLLRLSSIRNGFAHTPVTHHHRMHANSDKPNEVEQVMYVMLSDGIIKKQPTTTYFKEFRDRSIDVIKQLTTIYELLS